MAQTTRPLAYYMLAGLQQRLQPALNLPNKPYLSSIGQLRELVMNPNQNAGHQIQYPISYIKLTGTDINEKGVRANRLASRGILTQQTAEGHDANRLSLVPTTFRIDVGYICSDFEQVMDFVQRWTMASIKYRCNFLITYRGIDLDVIVNMNPEITVPEKEDLITSDKPDFFELIATAEIEGFMNNIDALDDQEVPLIRDTVPALVVKANSTQSPMARAVAAANALHNNKAGNPEDPSALDYIQHVDRSKIR